MSRLRSLIALGLLCMVGALVVYDLSVAVAPLEMTYVAMPIASAVLFMLGFTVVIMALTAHVTGTRLRPLLQAPRSVSQTRRQRYDWGEGSSVASRV